MSPSPPRWFGRELVARLLDPSMLVERVEQALRDVADNEATELRPARIDAPEHAANYVAFPAYWPRHGVASVKALAGAEKNPALGLPMIDAVVVVFDAPTGVIRAIMDGRAITAMRTAAASAVAIRALQPPANATVGLIGTGAQMQAHARTLAAILSPREFRIASAQGEMARASEAAAWVASETGVAARAASVADAARCDVVVTMSLSPEPLLSSGDLRPDAVLACVGPFTPARMEIDPAIVSGAALVVSDWASRLRDHWRHDAARLGRAWNDLVDLNDLLTDRAAPPSTGVRLFLSDGRPIEDLAAASLVLERADEAGISGEAFR